MGVKKVDGTALTVTTQENGSKKTFDKKFAIALDFDFFKTSGESIGTLRRFDC